MKLYDKIPGSNFGWVLVILSITAMIIVSIMSSGCSARRYSHKKFDAKGKLVEHIELKSDQWILKSKIENIHAKITDPCSAVVRELSVGKLKQDPDPNSIKAITEGVVEGLGHAMKGL